MPFCSLPLVSMLFLGALPNAPERPRDGTYVYHTQVGGVDIATDRIVISSTDDTVTVQDGANIQVRGITATATSTFDAATLGQTGYTADFTLSSGKQHTIVDIAPGVLTVHASGQSVPIKADPSAPFELTGDNLADSFVLLPAILHARGLQAFTLAVLSGAIPLPSRVQWNPMETRPTDLPATDVPLKITFGTLDEIFWYNSQTYTVDRVLIPIENAQISLVSTTLGVVAPPSPQVEQTPLPTPFPHFSSHDVRFSSSDGTRLAGTVTVPDGTSHRYPAVILVHGSGAEDRDERIGPNPVFLQISNALSNAGYVVLRYDKRGIGKSGGNAANSTRDDLLADVRAAWAFARTQPNVNPHEIFILGHSEGGELVPTVAAGRRGLAGIILMAPPSLPLWEVSLQQALSSVPPSQRAAARSEELAALEKIRNGTTTGAGMPWYRTSMDVDPIVDIRRVYAPILILQGGSDLQVLPSDLPRLVRAARSTNHDVSVHIFPGDNHLFMKVAPGEPATLQAALHQYLYVPGYVDPAVLRALITWLNAHARHEL